MSAGFGAYIELPDDYRFLRKFIKCKGTVGIFAECTYTVSMCNFIYFPFTYKKQNFDSVQIRYSYIS